MSPARREAVFWEAEAATGAAADSAAALAASLRVNVPGLRSNSGSCSHFCERAAACAARSKRRGIFGSLMDRCGAPKDAQQQR